MTRPKGDHIKPEDVNFIEGAEIQQVEGEQPSSLSLIHNYVLLRSKKGELTSARMLRIETGLGYTSVRYRLNELVNKKLILRKYAVARSGMSKTILPFYVGVEYADLLEPKTLKIPKRK